MFISLLPALLIALAAPAAADIAVTARSQGFPTRCAEKDNVLVALEEPTVTTFRIRASHPAYLARQEGDSMAPDFTDCVFDPEPIWSFGDHFTTELYRDERIILRGHRLQKTWRPEEVDFIVGDRLVRGLHLTQLFVLLDGREVEVLVLYPNDGHWRPKPLPPVDRDDTGYGASILLGPIEVDRRPLVKIREVRFDPTTLTYHLRFSNGGTGSVRVASISRAVQELEVRFDQPIAGAPFAIMSSMHVTDDNADISRLAIRAAGSAFWSSMPIDRLDVATGAEFAFGRDLPSRHNYSAPDVGFGPFSTN